MKLVSTDLLLVERLFTAVYWPATLWIQKVVLLFLYPKIQSSQLSFRSGNIAALLFVVDEIEPLQIYVHIFTYRQI